jgi:hypothetical protein
MTAKSSTCIIHEHFCCIADPLLQRASGQRARPSDPHRTARVRIGFSGLRALVSQRGSEISRRIAMNNRGGAGNWDRSISGSLAQPKPCSARPTEEPAHEKDAKEPRTRIQGPSGLSRDSGREDTGELAEHCEVHPTQISEWTQQLTASAAAVFGGMPRAKAAEPDLKVLHAKIGPLTLEQDC